MPQHVTSHPEWAGFPVEAVPRPVILLEEPVLIERGFVDGDAKEAWLAGAVETEVALPDGLLDRLTGGRPRRTGSRPLVVTSVEPVTADFRCDRGPRSLPAYRLSVTGMLDPCVALDPHVEPWWPRAGETPALSPAPATVEDDDRTVHLPAYGGVLTVFHEAEFTEHAAYVVGHPVVSIRVVPAGTAIPLPLIGGTVTGRLREPLGGRVLVTEGGVPLAVVPAATNR